MPSDGNNLYALVDPGSPPKAGKFTGNRMVEAPGTAPGSDGFITKPVYRHSRQADEVGIPFFTVKS